MEQYLEIKRAAEFRSEYIDGEVYAMSGGSKNHALIAMAAGARLDEQLRGRPCAVANLGSSTNEQSSRNEPRTRWGNRSLKHSHPTGERRPEPSAVDER